MRSDKTKSLELGRLLPYVMRKFLMASAMLVTFVITPAFARVDSNAGTIAGSSVSGNSGAAMVVKGSKAGAQGSVNTTANAQTNARPGTSYSTGASNTTLSGSTNGKAVVKGAGSSDYNAGSVAVVPKSSTTKKPR
jgi:hypothetical protein